MVKDFLVQGTTRTAVPLQYAKQGWIQECWLGDPNYGSERTFEFFVVNYFYPIPHLTSWGCTYLNSTGCPLWNILLLCLITKIVQGLLTWMSRSQGKCMSACPDNHWADIVFVRFDLIHCKPENECSALAELNKTDMLGYISSPAYFTHLKRFPGSSSKWVCTVSESIAIPLTQKGERMV